LRRNASIGIKETTLREKRQKLSTSGVRRPAMTFAETQLPPQVTIDMTIRKVKIRADYYWGVQPVSCVRTFVYCAENPETFQSLAGPATLCSV